MCCERTKSMALHSGTNEQADQAMSSTADLLAAKVSSLHRSAHVIDTHCDTPLRIIDPETWLPCLDIGQPTQLMVDIPKLQSAGVSIQVFAANTGGYALDGGGQNFSKSNSRLLALVLAIHHVLTHGSHEVGPVTCAPDLEKRPGQGRIGILASIEGAYSFCPENAHELLRQYHDLNIRMLSPVWNNSNALGEGVAGQYPDQSPSAGGLTELGQAVIRDMNDLGIIIDVSHMNEKTFWDTLAISKAPVIASHSSAYALCPHIRNLKDDQIRAIADTGGVVQVNFHRPFLSADPSLATLDTVVAHIDHIVKVGGIDAVGLGSDFDGADMPAELSDASKLPDLTRALLQHGYHDDQIVKILGENSARLFNRVFALATAASSVDGGLVIHTDIGMGEARDRMAPLSAHYTLSPDAVLDTSRVRIILDGISHPVTVDPAAKTISWTPPPALPEAFHAVTFSAACQGCPDVRHTVIYHLR